MGGLLCTGDASTGKLSYMRMSTRNVTIAAKLYLLLGASLCAGVIVSAVLWSELRRVTRDYAAVFTTQVKARSEARKIEVAEKMQVQEWSNLLLRGADSIDRDRYTKTFHDRGKEVRDHLETVRGILTNELHDSVSLDEATRFGTAYDSMAVRYATALALFEARHNATQV